MSIISREAELKYPDGVPGLDPIPLRSGYMDGADREPTDAEIEAAAEQLYYADCNAVGLFLDLSWDMLSNGNKTDYRNRVRKVFDAARKKAMEETGETAGKGGLSNRQVEELARAEFRKDHPGELWSAAGFKTRAQYRFLALRESRKESE